MILITMFKVSALSGKAEWYKFGNLLSLFVGESISFFAIDGRTRTYPEVFACLAEHVHTEVEQGKAA